MNAGGGTRFGRYRLLRQIASDEVSTTYFATSDEPAQRPGAPAPQFAVRIADRVDPDDDHAVDMARLYLSEAQRAAVIDHPAVVRPRDLGMLDEQPYVAMPFVRAVPLAELLSHDGTINQAAALAMFAQLAGALDAAHRAGIIHGALSPQTIWVGPSAGEGIAYVTYLTGFGTATLLRDRMAATPRGGPVDDVLYVSPEQLRGEPVTGASDQYALACALYHTLAGRPPFERETRSKLYGAHLLVAPPDLAAEESAVAPATSAALIRAMAKDPGERFASCGEMIHAALPVGSDTLATAGAPQRRGAAALAGATPLRLWLPAAAVLAVVVIVGGALWALFGADAPPPVAQGDDDTQMSAAIGTPAATETPAAGAASTARAVVWDVALGDRPVRKVTAAGDAVLAADDVSVAAFDAAGGTQRWKADVPGVAEVTFGGDTVAVTGDDGLTALEAGDGAVAWRAGDGPSRSVTVAAGSVVGIARPPREEPEILALAAADGAELWHLHARGEADDIFAVARRRRTYVLHDGELGAIDGTGARSTTAGRHQVSDYTWTTGVDPLWPVLAPADGFVAVATTEGRVCRHDAADGDIRWCETVPGVADEQPRLFVVAGTVVAATSEAVVGLDGGSGQTAWSVSPGSPSNVVAAADGNVAVADDTAVRVLDARTGEVTAELTELGDVTAVAVSAGTVHVGTDAGTVLAVRLDAG